MKHKKRIALALITVLSLSALSLSSFADMPAIDSSSDTTVQETQNDHQQRKNDKKTTQNASDDQSSDSVTGDTTRDSRGHGRHHGKRSDNQIAEPENAIGKDSAKAKALEDAGVTEEQAGRIMSRVSQLDDGTVVYKVRFICNDQHYAYQINAISGEIVDKSTDTATKEKMKKSRENNRTSSEKNNETTDSSAATSSTAA